MLFQFRLVKFRARFFRLGYCLATRSVSCVRGLLVRFKNLKPGITSRSDHTCRNERIVYIGGGIDICSVMNKDDKKLSLQWRSCSLIDI